MLRYIVQVLFLAALPALAQVNGYARLSGISGTTLYVGSANETFASFAAGKQVVVMQMQDDVIGSNTGNNAAFGDLGDIRSTGLFEVRQVVSVTRAGPTLTEVTLDRTLGNTYNFGENASVQAITLELLGGGGDFTTTAAITALAWNGTLGGVVAVHVEGTLTLAHNITADGAGFRGGVRDSNTSGTCEVATFLSAKTDRFAYKGEGIYRSTTPAWEAAKGKILNGGGGGNDHNGGGGGGGNYTAGGLSGPGYGCGAGHAGGLGGIALGAHVTAQRVFMGGGGGGGEGNNNVSTDGGNGGGIVLIKAAALRTTGTCGGRRISADGANVPIAGNDGGGGGGAGGSIVLQVDNYDISGSCLLTVRANGGTGGTVNDAAIHGGGGGGGQGAVVFSTGIPGGNVTVSTNNGAGGCNNNSNPCNSFAGSGSGTNGSGLVGNGFTPLPVELLSFQAIADGDRVAVTWSTATERDNDYFAVERSTDGSGWQEVARLSGAGTTHTTSFYRAYDQEPFPGLSYYRLQQVDRDGRSTLSPAVTVRFNGSAGILRVFPNPASDRVTVHYQGTSDPAVLRMLNDMGQTVGPDRAIQAGSTGIDLSGYAPGCYTIVLATDERVLHQRIVVRR